MQLAILLSLIQTRGGSLPDKRTALYDNYVELFFNRECEKSSVVRDNRDLLIGIHRHLAWVLHIAAQTKRDRGAISAAQLRELVIKYLVAEQHSMAIIDDLFAGMVERVVALVSRVEGTYEFEVQPLREYFAARHLYDTAPYSPPGNEKNGTLIDIFAAISRDFYWLNVTRFFAGCFSKGELPSLVDLLEELSTSKGYRDTNHPRLLAAMLLADWVFAQHPKAMKRVVRLVLDDIGLRFITSGGRRFMRPQPFVLPRYCGNDELVERCFELLEMQPYDDCRWMLVEILEANSSRSDTRDKWLAKLNGKSGSDLTKWIEYGLSLGVLHELQDCTVEKILADEADVLERLVLLFRGGGRRIINSKEEYFELILRYVRDANLDFSHARPPSVLECTMMYLSPQVYSFAVFNPGPGTLAQIFGPDVDLLRLEEDMPSFSNARPCLEFVREARGVYELPMIDWSKSLDPWEKLIGSARNVLGECWSLRVLANYASAINSRAELCVEARNLFDVSISLPRRARFARLRSSGLSWWQDTFRRAENGEDVAFALLLFTSWAGSQLWLKLIVVVDALVRNLSTRVWQRLAEAVLHFQVNRRRKADVLFDVSEIRQNISERLTVLLCLRAKQEMADELFSRFLKRYDGDDSAVFGFIQRMALQTVEDSPEAWADWLPVISESYMAGARDDVFFGYKFVKAGAGENLWPEVIEEIVQNAKKYPIELVRLAEESARKNLAENLIPVGDIAEQQHWFST